MTWWLAPHAPGETRLDRLTYMLREVLSRYDAPDCDIVIDGRCVSLKVAVSA